MKISPVSNPSPTAQQAPVARSVKMATNATPGLSGLVEEEQTDEKLPIPAINEALPAEEATQPISPQFAALAKQRRAIQRDRQLLEQQKAELAAKSQGSDQIPISRLKEEPLKVLQEAGVTYEDLTQAILNNPVDEKYQTLEQEIASLKQGIDKKFSENETRSEQAVLAEMRREAEGLIKADDTFELVRETGSMPHVMKLIEKTYRETGEVLDVTEALKLVEDELLARNQKLVNLKKIQGLFKQPEPEVAPQPRQVGMRTLTNRDTASVPQSSKARALAAFYGTLKK